MMAKQQLNIRISAWTRAQLDQLAAYYGESVGQVISRLVDRAANEISMRAGLREAGGLGDFVKVFDDVQTVHRCALPSHDVRKSDG